MAIENVSSISLVNLVMQADIIVQSVMAVLVFASVVSWSLVFDKYFKFRILKNRTVCFEDHFETKMIEDVYNIALKRIIIQWR